MVFGRKTNGFFIENNGHSMLLARTDVQTGPMVVQELQSCASNDADAIANAIKSLVPKRSGQYIHATCGVYPANRLVRHASLDPKRFREPDYVNEVLANVVHVESDKFTLALLNADDGTDFDLTITAKKEALFAGLPNEDIINIQNKYLEQGVYPDRLEIGTLSTLGAITDYLKFSGAKVPTLVLEIDDDNTQSFIISSSGVENSRIIPQGLEAMIPAVQKELGLKDADAARKLFYSNAFDFTGLGPALIKKLLKELQSSIGFYEVQTGQSIGHVICTLLPPKLAWLENSISGQLGVGTLTIDYTSWLTARGITFDGDAQKQELNNRWLGLFSLMINHNNAVTA